MDRGNRDSLYRAVYVYIECIDGMEGMEGICDQYGDNTTVVLCTSHTSHAVLLRQQLLHNISYNVTPTVMLRKL